jgi:hypothetical protein
MTGVVARFGDDTEPAVRERVAGALFNKGVRLGGVGGRSDEEIAVYDGVVARFGDDTEPGGPRTGRRGAVQQRCPARGVGAFLTRRSLSMTGWLSGSAMTPNRRSANGSPGRCSTKVSGSGCWGRSDEEIAVYDGVVCPVRR